MAVSACSVASLIGFIYGTTGELIKLAPLIRELERRGRPSLMLCTGQQVTQLPAFQEELGLPPVSLWLGRGADGEDLVDKAQIPGWAAGVGVAVTRARHRLRRALAADGLRPQLVVHGDTFTTVLGALAGRVLGVPVAHVEAGLRSGDLRNPFPEEVNRRLVSRLVAVHYAPGERAVANLRAERVGGEILDTQQNTVRDAVGLATGAMPSAVELPGEPFGLVSIHRFELIEREQTFRELLELLHTHSRRQPLLFVDHSTTAAVIDRSPLLAALFDERLRRIPRLPYLNFIALLKRAEFLVSDSGGSQEECAFLGLPCLIHRSVSERTDGLDGSVVLSGLDLNVAQDFLSAPQRRRVAPAQPGAWPSGRIADDLAARGVI